MTKIELLRDKIVKKLNIVYDRVTSIKSFFDEKESTGFEIAELEAREILLSNTWTEFQGITDLATELTGEFYDQIRSAIGEFESIYLRVYANVSEQLSRLREPVAISQRESGNSRVVVAADNHMPKCSLNLPELKIKPFDGNPAEWVVFKEKYMLIIHSNVNVPPILKFSYFDDCLRGEAKATIGHITLSAEAYRLAWTELVKRYDDKRLIVDSHVKKLTSLPSLAGDNPQLLRELLNSVNSHVSSLEALDIRLDTMSELFLISMVTQKFNRSLIRKWKSQLEQNINPTWVKLKEFMSKECRILQVSNGLLDATAVKLQSKPIKAKAFVVSTGNSSSSAKFKANSGSCDLCGEQAHAWYMCAKFLAMTPQNRSELVMKRRRCINCLRVGHLLKECTSQRCKNCQKPHHTLLYFPKTGDEGQQSSTSDSQGSESIATGKSSSLMALCNANSQSNTVHKKRVLFATAVIKLVDRNGKLHECRALLDNASSDNYMSETFAKTVQLNSSSINSEVQTLNGGIVRINKCVSAVIQSRLSNYKQELQFSVVPEITSKLPSSDFSFSRWGIPNSVQLADPGFNSVRAIDVLLGLETFWDVLLLNVIRLKSGLPTLQASKLGYIVTGAYVQSPHSLAFCSVSGESCSDTVELAELNRSIKKFWELERLPEKRFMSAEETYCESHFDATHYRDSTGRYVVSLPVKGNSHELGDSREAAMRRFLWLEKRFLANKQLKDQYCQFMTEYEELGHMSRVLENDGSNKSMYYLPHHAILKPTSSTTKCRVVFDASAKSSTGVSLNDALCMGPTVQSELWEIILRFRKHQYVITADISKMYRQMWMNPDQRVLQRILWRKSDHEPIEHYELNTVTYGTKSAPYLATKVLQQLAHDESSRLSRASEVLRTDFYVDDCLTGTNSLNDAVKLVNELKQLLRSAGMHIHKWCANSADILSDIPLQDREILNDSFSMGESIKALGLLWAPKKDQFFFNVQELNDSQMLTKRKVLSKIAKLFDPLGLLAPVVITSKMIMQSIWAQGTDWDAEVSDEIREKWVTFRSQLPRLNRISVPRLVLLSEYQAVQLHGFSDASSVAYGACVYIRSNINERVMVRLLCAKSRVAPLSNVTIPRMELLACVLLAELVELVVKAINIQFNNVVLWSDSTIALSWINTSTHKLKQFVANRVDKIQKLTSSYVWCHVSTDQNPADQISRGVYPGELEFSSMWWEGPSFLKNTNDEFSPYNGKGDYNGDSTEMKSESKVFVTSEIVSFPVIFKFSSFLKTVRVLAGCIRFIKRCQRMSSEIPDNLSVDDIENAKLVLVKIIQKKEFSREYSNLQSNLQVHRKSELRSLCPFLDSQGVMRVGGRISNASIPYDAKHQILMPKRHHLSLLIFKYYHQKNMHAGAQLLVSLVRQSYWVPNSKNLAKKIIRECVTCFKVNPPRRFQLMGNLPESRVTPSSPFVVTGVDLCGPYLVKHFVRQKTNEKVYVLSFVCFSSKAVHFEVVKSLSSDSFISALKRFIARRGKPHTIWSDNGTNFTGANNELKQAYEQFNNHMILRGIPEFCTLEEIRWKFIPPRAPNFGGLWEASIKSFKSHLQKILFSSTTNLYFDEFITLITEIEGILNSRPLTVISDDPKDQFPLTPGHFLIGRPIVFSALPSYEGYPVAGLLNWQKVSRLTQQFWRRYSVEYLHTLQQRNKWSEISPNLKEGDVVLLREESLAPTQ